METTQRNVRLTAEVGAALARFGTLREALTACAVAIVNAFDAAFARVWTFNDAERMLELEASAGMYTHIDGGHARIPLGAFKIGKIAEERAAHLTNDVHHDPRVGDRAWAAREGLVSFAGYPLLLDDRLLGVLAMFARAPLGQETLDGLAGVADLIAVGIARKRSEDALRRSEARYAQILDSVSDMIFCKSPELTVTYANKATCDYYGMSAAELRAITDVPWNGRDLTAAYLADDLEVLRTGRRVENPAEPNLSRTGDKRLFYTVKSPIRDADGNVVEIVGVARDVTEARRAEASERFLAAASVQLADSIEWEETLSRVARLAVPEFADWCAVDMLVGGDIRRVAVAHVDPAKVELAHEMERRWPAKPGDPGMPEVLRTGEPLLVAQADPELLGAQVRDPELLRLIRELGLRSWMVVPLKLHGRVLGAMTFVAAESQRSYGQTDLAFAEELARRAAVAVENSRLFDETRRALRSRDEALAEVKRLNEELEVRVAERTRELTEAYRELESFSYTVSHDLRAPIRHISGFVDLLRERVGTNLDATSARYLRTVADSAKHMGLLIDVLLTFSRLGRAELNKERVELDRVVRDVLREMEPDLAGRKIGWEIQPLPAVVGDPTMLRMVMSNLLSNAVKYTRARAEAAIEIGARPLADGNQIEIYVKDNGVGFNMEYAGKLFGVFQRLHAAPHYEGTGIGLATVRRVVHRHGGRVWAEGKEGEAGGATFHITLPLAGEAWARES